MENKDDSDIIFESDGWDLHDSDLIKKVEIAHNKLIKGEIISIFSNTDFGVVFSLPKVLHPNMTFNSLEEDTAVISISERDRKFDEDEYKNLAPWKNLLILNANLLLLYPQNALNDPYLTKVLVKRNDDRLWQVEDLQEYETKLNKYENRDDWDIHDFFRYFFKGFDLDIKSTYGENPYAETMRDVVIIGKKSEELTQELVLLIRIFNLKDVEIPIIKTKDDFFIIHFYDLNEFHIFEREETQIKEMLLFDFLYEIHEKIIQINNLFEAKFHLKIKCGFVYDAIKNGPNPNIAYVCEDSKDFMHLIFDLNSIIESINGGEFINFISSEVVEKKKITKGQSINILQKFLLEKGYDPENVIKNLRIVRKLRSNHPSTHKTTRGSVEYINNLKKIGIFYPIEDFYDAQKILLKIFIKILRDLANLL